MFSLGTMQLVAGGIVGLGVLMMLKKAWKGAVKKGELAGQKFTCPACNATCDAADAWKRTRIGGAEVYRCPSCGHKVVK